MALFVNNTEYKWYEKSIVVDGVTLSSPDSPGDIIVGTTKVHGLTNFASETTLFSSSLAPDSVQLENVVVPAFQNTYADAFFSQGYIQGPGADSQYRVYLKRGYRIVSSDGTFVGTDSPGTSVIFLEYITVTGINTSHNGGTTFTLRRDNGV